MVKSYRFGRFLDGLVPFAAGSQPELGCVLWRCSHLSLSLPPSTRHSAKFNLFHGFTLTVTENWSLFTSLRHVYILLKSTRFQFRPLEEVKWPNKNIKLNIKKFHIIKSLNLVIEIILILERKKYNNFLNFFSQLAFGNF